MNKTRNAIPGVVAAILAVGAGMASFSAVAQTAPGGPPPGGGNMGPPPGGTAGGPPPSGGMGGNCTPKPDGTKPPGC